MNASSSDELINDSDTDMSIAAEDYSDIRFGISAAASYDCHPSECARDAIHVSTGDGCRASSLGGAE